MFLKGKKISKERGVALLIVTLMVVLLSMLVMQVSHSTFLYSRSVGRMESNVQAEYLLKSVLNIGAAMIEQDATPNYDSYSEDIWGQFSSGVPIPNDYLAQVGINYPGVLVELEIVPENSKINIAHPELKASGEGSTSDSVKPAQYATKKLFENLGFDQGDLFDTSGQFSPVNKTFNSKELTSNLIDFYDNNADSYTSNVTLDDGDILDPGIESSLPDNYFPKEGRRVGKFEINELLIVPGMTPMRLRALIPFATVYGRTDVNINCANATVLSSIHPEIDATVASDIIEYRQTNGAFKNASELNNIATFTNLRGLETRSKLFELIAKVQFGDTKAHYIRSRIERSNPSTPTQVLNITMY